MKKLLIFYIVLIIITTLSLTKSPQEIKGKGITEQEIESYRNSIIENAKERGWDLTDQQINDTVNMHKEEMAKSNKTKGVSFMEALPSGFKISTIICVIVGFILFVKGSYYNELLGSGLWKAGRESTREGRMEIKQVEDKRRFWGRWFSG